MPAVQFWVSSFKNRSTQPARRENNLLRIQAFRRVFQHDLADFGNQNTKSGDSWHDLGEKVSDLVKSLLDLARSHRILDRSGEISPIFSFFQWFLAGFSFTQNRCSPDGKPTRKTRSLVVRLRVGHLPTRSPVGRLQVRHKPDPPACGQP